MEISIQFSTVLYAVISFVCGLTGILLILFSKPANSPNRLLGFSYLSFSFIYVVVFAIDSRAILQLPHLYRVGNVFGLLFMPLSYLCIRTYITRQDLKLRDLIHALPALLYVIDLGPFLMSSAEHKIAVLNQTMLNLRAVTEFKETWLLPGNYYTIGRSVLMSVYWILQVLLLVKLFRKGDKIFLKNNSNWLKWQRVYNGFQFFVFFPTLVFLVLGLVNQLYSVINLSAGISVLLTAISMFFYPGILYGNQELKTDQEGIGVEYKLQPQEPHSEEEISAGSYSYVKDLQAGGDNFYLYPVQYKFDPYSPVNKGLNYEMRSKQPMLDAKEGERKYYHFNEEQVVQITGQLNELMQNEKPFLKKGFSIKDLALQINLPAYQLSAFINIESGMHFNDYINRLRISYCEKLIENGEIENLNLFGLADKCGFHNRNTFATAFKKYTGLTPSMFLKSLNK